MSRKHKPPPSQAAPGSGRLPRGPDPAARPAPRPPRPNKVLLATATLLLIAWMACLAALAILSQASRL